MQAAQSNSGVLALHEYAWPTMDTNAEWLSLRHRKVYEGDPEQGWAGFPAELKGLPLIITECGLGAFIDVDASVQFGDVGWKALYGDKPEQYLEQLRWYSSELRKDPYVLGAAVFLCLGELYWDSFEICPDLVEAIIEASRGALPPTAEPLPP